MQVYCAIDTIFIVTILTHTINADYNPWLYVPQQWIVFYFSDREMKDLAVKFGKKLRQVRKQKGISQDKLALVANIDRSYVGRIERGEVNITLEKVYQLAEVLECNAVDLLPDN